MNSVSNWLQKQWYKKSLHPLLWVFIPLSLLYVFFVKIRKAYYQSNRISKASFPIPIVVVGNLTVGGTGKTPLVIHIVKVLKQYGLRPGVVSRGYGGSHSKTSQEPLWVYANSDPKQVGDEPLLLAKRVFCPIVIAANRIKAVQSLLDSGQVDVVISDDGLQHEKLKRDIEIIVIDGKKRLGNGWCLPVGPLREPSQRLEEVDFIVCNDPIQFDNDQEYDMVLRPRTLSSGLEPSQQNSINFFQGQTVHAIAGIGFPERFFDLLTKHDLKVIPHPFPDHYPFQQKDIEFNDDLPILLTEKDAVKCSGLMSHKHWVLSVDSAVNPLFDMRLLKRLDELRNQNLEQV
jgi:tetraacyldisaccharide 4'-kinase